MTEFDKAVEEIMPSVKNDLLDAYNFLSPIFKRPPKDVVLYAAGKSCERIYRYLTSRGIEISAVCDKNKRGKFLNTDINIISMDDLCKTYRDAWIVICTFNYSVEAIRELFLRNIPEKNMLRASFASNLLYFTADEFMNDRNLQEGYRYAYDLAADSESKGVVIDVLRKDMTGNHILRRTSKMAGEFEYFDFDFSDKEVFVQAGCFTGDTVEAFIKFRNNRKNDVIFTFEADKGNYEAAKERLSAYSNVFLLNLGLWERKDTLYFVSEHNEFSRVVSWGNDECKVPVTDLDSFFAARSEWPTFIQLDIEGSEPQAILGARNVIKKAKPKLAICVYHNQNHIYEIPRIIKQINPEYKRFRFVQAFDAIADTLLFVD